MHGAIIIEGAIRTDEQSYRMIYIGREIAYHYGLCGLCDDQLRQLGERWHAGLHTEIEVGY
jgi:hypothetical protein